MRVTSKGQVTIPRDVRDRAGIKPGSEVEFGGEGELVTLRRTTTRARPGRTRGERLVEAIRGTRTKNKHLTTDEIMQLLRGDD